MKINFFNVVICLGYTSLLFVSIWKFINTWNRGKIFKYFYAFLLMSSLVVLMVLTFDFGLVKIYPWIVAFFIPFQYLAPVYFTAFVCYYIERKSLYLKNRKYLFLPFISFFILYSFLKINVFLGHPWISKDTVTLLHTEVDENSALAFSIILSVWNFFNILKYEKTLSNYSFTHVQKKTRWIKTLTGIFIIFNIVWLLTVILFFIREDIGGHFPYYPYWILYAVFYFALLFLGSKHIKKVKYNSTREQANLERTISNFQLSGLNHIFNTQEQQQIFDETPEINGVLSYFATSLFDKNKTEDVLWDITENCISQLQLEDTIIYMVNEQTGTLAQKAAFGNKNKGERKILSPLVIPLGEGIVGQVAQTGKYQYVPDTTKNAVYIEDDQRRYSELAVPIIIDDKVIGVLDSEHSKKNFFSKKYILLFKLIAKLTAKKLAHIESKSISITNDNVYFKELDVLMKEAKIYRDSHLSLESVAKKLKISSNYLSQLVNKLSEKNFSDYINNYRIEDAKTKLKDPQFANYTIIAIGLEAGFNSKSTFYNAFKKHAGMSPKAYRENT